jgi:hypothetical protein
VLARQYSIERELRNIIATGEETKLFLNNKDGIWFSGVNKKKSGHIMIGRTSEVNTWIHIPCQSHDEFSTKKAGVKSTNPSSLPTSSTSSTTSLTNDKVSSEIDDRFELIRVEINNQRLCNAVFDDRINFLEVTTQNIKSKVDKIIDHLEASLPTMHKLRKTLHVSLNEFQHHPGLNSSLNTDSGSMIEWWKQTKNTPTLSATTKPITNFNTTFPTYPKF